MGGRLGDVCAVFERMKLMTNGEMLYLLIPLAGAGFFTLVFGYLSSRAW